MASITPATTLASVCRAAKPMIAAATTPDASTLAAIRLTPSNCERASASPIRRIVA